MAKPIYASEEEVMKILKEIKEQILGTKICGAIDIKRNFAKDTRQADLFFTPEAWTKMTALIKEFDTEVQWHGCVHRLAKSKFEIYDILVPPHVVTGSTVTSDPEKYANWINELDDETFNNLRFHGHSHVNMGVYPSTTDTTYRKDVVTQIPTPKNEDEDAFYIFLILNKKGEWSGEIYDLRENALYETSDISIDVYTNDTNGLLSNFLEDAKKQATKEAPKSTVTISSSESRNSKKPEEKKTSGASKSDKKTSPSYYDGGYGYGYGGGYSGGIWDDDDNPNSPFYVRGY